MGRRSGKAIAQKILRQRETLWPNADLYLWHRNKSKGFTTIPKTMPFILLALDEMANGKPLSQTYLSLWCETWDNSMLNAAKKDGLAFSAGFSKQRAEYIWRGRIKMLQELGFIDIQAGKSGDISHILIWNPHIIIHWHHKNNTPGLTKGTYNALLEKAIEIGAEDDLSFPDDPNPSDQSSARPILFIPTK
ncbi:MAG: hypothetical protein FWF24_06085 [Alphaproteobacteria bacterium]|nr:hypothetical protein [Alphaproteobacteria bacterium]